MKKFFSLRIDFSFVPIMMLVAVCWNCYGQTDPGNQPPPGTYFSMQLMNVPPTPFDPLPTLEIYADPAAPPGIYFYDDR